MCHVVKEGGRGGYWDPESRRQNELELVLHLLRTQDMTAKIERLTSVEQMQVMVSFRTTFILSLCFCFKDEKRLGIVV